MIRTSSVNGSSEMKDEALAMAIEALTPAEQKEWCMITLEAIVRRDPEDCGSVQVGSCVQSSHPADEYFLLPSWKKLLIKWLKLPII